MGRRQKGAVAIGKEMEDEEEEPKPSGADEDDDADDAEAPLQSCGSGDELTPAQAPAARGDMSAKVRKTCRIVTYGCLALVAAWFLRTGGGTEAEPQGEAEEATRSTRSSSRQGAVGAGFSSRADLLAKELAAVAKEKMERKEEEEGAGAPEMFPARPHEVKAIYEMQEDGKTHIVDMRDDQALTEFELIPLVRRFKTRGLAGCGVAHPRVHHDGNSTTLTGGPGSADWATHLVEHSLTLALASLAGRSAFVTPVGGLHPSLYFSSYRPLPEGLYEMAVSKKGICPSKQINKYTFFKMTRGGGCRSADNITLAKAILNEPGVQHMSWQSLSFKRLAKGAFQESFWTEMASPAVALRKVLKLDGPGILQGCLLRSVYSDLAPLMLAKVEAVLQQLASNDVLIALDNQKAPIKRHFITQVNTLIGELESHSGSGGQAQVRARVVVLRPRPGEEAQAIWSERALVLPPLEAEEEKLMPPASAAGTVGADEPELPGNVRTIMEWYLMALADVTLLDVPSLLFTSAANMGLQRDCHFTGKSSLLNEDDRKSCVRRVVIGMRR